MNRININSFGLIELKKKELLCTQGGILYRIGNWIGCKIRGAYSGGTGGEYDRDSQLEALSNYGATY